MKLQLGKNVMKEQQQQQNCVVQTTVPDASRERFPSVMTLRSGRSFLDRGEECFRASEGIQSQALGPAGRPCLLGGLRPRVLPQVEGAPASGHGSFEAHGKGLTWIQPKSINKLLKGF